jgi:Ca2+/Na+ antiporter
VLRSFLVIRPIDFGENHVRPSSFIHLFLLAQRMNLRMKTFFINNKASYTMWLGIIILAYVIGLLLFIRFMQTVHQWDDEIEAMENESSNTEKSHAMRYRSAS